MSRMCRSQKQIPRFWTFLPIISHKREKLTAYFFVEILFISLIAYCPYFNTHFFGNTTTPSYGWDFLKFIYMLKSESITNQLIPQIYLTASISEGI